MTFSFFSAFFGVYEESDLPPYIPIFTSEVISVQPSLRSYEQPASTTQVREMGTQVSFNIEHCL